MAYESGGRTKETLPLNLPRLVSKDFENCSSCVLTDDLSQENGVSSFLLFSFIFPFL